MLFLLRASAFIPPFDSTLSSLASWRSFTPPYVINRLTLRLPHSTRRRWYHARHTRRLDEDHAPERIGPFPTPPHARRRVRRTRRLDRLGPDARARHLHRRLDHVGGVPRRAGLHHPLAHHAGVGRGMNPVGNATAETPRRRDRRREETES